MGYQAAAAMATAASRRRHALLIAHQTQEICPSLLKPEGRGTASLISAANRAGHGVQRAVAWNRENLADTGSHRVCRESSETCERKELRLFSKERKEPQA